ncbi:non-homologous end-joining DNA ligase [Bordetella flabilis]|uniref:DNA ligase (ATP) n=1 Tax=Bordetella flabilis TaxID=463014 RepID=A0A193GN51_9BORD|nr:non-homologous end-joining DNA ligase [Bordetella flabilis]ANN80799.1 hypothetical protein BAU07_26055 [Bordetella flabilis]
MARLPEFVKPQLATLVRAPPNDPCYVYEIKYDGYRMVCRIDRKAVRFFSRDAKDWTAEVQSLADAISALKLGTGWLDGELVVLDENGIPDFNLLQNMRSRKVARNVRFVAFDIPFWGGKDLRELPFIERAAALEELLCDLPANGPIIRSKVVDLSDPGDAAGLHKQACKMGLEGLMGKRRDAPYRAGRTNTWIKLPCRKKDEFLIIGWSTAEGSPSAFGSLLLGQYDDAGQVHYAGRVGSGLGGKTINQLLKLLKPLAADKAPIKERIPSARSAVGRNVTFNWVRPEVVVEVAYKERTKGGHLRHSSFLGLRKDKGASDVCPEKLGRPAKSA